MQKIRPTYSHLLLLSHFSHVRLCAMPSLGFSRQEHWSGLPFPSPMHRSEKWKWSRSVMCDSSWPHGLQPTRLLRPWDFPGKSTGVGPLPSPHSHLEAHKSQGQDTNSRASVSKDVAPFCQHENWESDIDLFPQSNSFTPEDTILSYFCLIQFSLSLHPHPPVSHRLFSNSTFEPDLTLSYHFSKRISLLLPLNSSNATSWKYSTLMPFHILLLI